MYWISQRRHFQKLFQNSRPPAVSCFASLPEGRPLANDDEDQSLTLSSRRSVREAVGTATARAERRGARRLAILRAPQQSHA